MSGYFDEISSDWEYQENGIDLSYTQKFLTEETTQNLLGILGSGIPWESRTIRMFGRTLLQPRGIAWMGDPDAVYTYSKNTFYPLPWTAELKNLKNQLTLHLGVEFNSVLLNFYRTPSDYMAWHSDNEKELGVNPSIASVSLGGSRYFSIRSKKNRGAFSRKILLENGSLLVMKGATQSNTEHMLHKGKKNDLPRINLTFRKIQT
jgi:alkylated DNA repair dioxygenase AlkB